MSDIVWRAQLNDRYTVQVDRHNASQGILTIVDDNSQHLLFRKLVLLSYGARFGPDVVDVTSWQRAASEFIAMFNRHERREEIDEVAKWGRTPNEVERNRAYEHWERIKEQLAITDTNIDERGPNKAMTRALKISGRDESQHPVSHLMNTLLTTAGQILGDFQTHIYRDDIAAYSYTIFWHRRNRWVSGRNFVYNLACAIDSEIKNPFSFDEKSDIADPDSEDAKIRDAIVGLNRA